MDRVQGLAERPPDNDSGESNEIFLPGKNVPFTIKRLLATSQPSLSYPKSKPLPADEIDNERKKSSVFDEKEPEYSFENPLVTEDEVEPSQCPDDPKPVNCCCLSKSSYLEKKRKNLLFAVTYHQKDKVKKMLDEGG